MDAESTNRRKSDRRGNERRTRPDRRPDRRAIAERRLQERRNGHESPELQLPDNLEELNQEIDANTDEIDRVSAQLVLLIDRSRALFEKRSWLMEKESNVTEPS